MCFGRPHHPDAELHAAVIPEIEGMYCKKRTCMGVSIIRVCSLLQPRNKCVLKHANSDCIHYVLKHNMASFVCAHVLKHVLKHITYPW